MLYITLHNFTINPAELGFLFKTFPRISSLQITQFQDKSDIQELSALDKKEDNHFSIYSKT